MVLDGRDLRLKPTTTCTLRGMAVATLTFRQGMALMRGLVFTIVRPLVAQTIQTRANNSSSSFPVSFKHRVLKKARESG